MTKNLSAHKKYIVSYISYFGVLVLVGSHPTSVRSAILEESPGGTVAFISGVSAELTSSEISEFASGSDNRSVDARLSHSELIGRPLILRRPTAVILDDSHERTSASAVKKGRRLPRPRALAEKLSRQQQQMRELTVQVANRFARAPGVAKAKLDRGSFVALFTAMIHRESNFNQKAVSPAGAKGLGQLMPGTARDLGVCDVFSPRDNLVGSATYLTAMLKRFASPTLALAAYNAGPGAVKRHAGIPPYSETRQYVADIVHAVNLAKQVPHTSSAVAVASETDAGRSDVLLASFSRSDDPQQVALPCNKNPGVAASKRES